MFKNEKERFLEIGYNKLLTQNKLDYLIKLSNRLANIEINTQTDFLEADKENLKNCLKQFLIQRRLYTVFNYEILLALGRKSNVLKMGLPKKFLVYLEENEKIKANTFLNSIRWKIFIFYWYLVGNYFIFKFFVKAIKLLSKSQSESEYIYFDNLSSKSLPKKRSNTIIDWYLRKRAKNEGLDVTHNVLQAKRSIIEGIAIYPIPIPFKNKINLSILIKYVFNAIVFSLKSFFKIFTKDFTNPLLLKEFPLLYFCKNAKKNQLAKIYFFHNSTSIFRPLWTYEAEKKKSKIIFFYYSTNNAPLKFDKGYQRSYGNREFMTWNNFYVWDEFQKEYVLNYFPKSKVDVVGPIWFESSGFAFKKNENNKKIVVVFDIQTVNENYYRKLGLPDRYITTSNMLKFHKDIFRVFNKIKNVNVILKRKRFQTSFQDPKYLNFIKENYKSEKYSQIHPQVDPIEIINQCYLSINFPPTSTAKISSFQKKHTIYYDPSKTVDPHDKSLSGIKLIRGYKGLESYINKLFHNDDVK